METDAWAVSIVEDIRRRGRDAWNSERDLLVYNTAEDRAASSPSFSYLSANTVSHDMQLYRIKTLMY